MSGPRQVRILTERNIVESESPIGLIDVDIAQHRPRPPMDSKSSTSMCLPVFFRVDFRRPTPSQLALFVQSGSRDVAGPGFRQPYLCSSR